MKKTAFFCHCLALQVCGCAGNRPAERGAVAPEPDSAHLLLAGLPTAATYRCFLPRSAHNWSKNLFPSTSGAHPRVLSMRSSDQVADPGVLSAAAEQAALGMKIVQLPATVHNDMRDGTTPRQRQEMECHLALLLNE